MVVYISLEVTEGVIRVAEIVKEIFFICFQPQFQKEAWGMDLFTTITLRFPNEGLREICLFDLKETVLKIIITWPTLGKRYLEKVLHRKYFNL